MELNKRGAREERFDWTHNRVPKIATARGREWEE